MQNSYLFFHKWFALKPFNLITVATLLLVMLVVAQSNLINLQGTLGLDSNATIDMRNLITSRPNELLDSYSTSKDVADIAVIVFWIIIACAGMALVNISSGIFKTFSELRQDSKFTFPSKSSKESYIKNSIAGFTIRYVSVIALTASTIFTISRSIPNVISSIQGGSIMGALLSVLYFIIGYYVALVSSRIFFIQPLT